MLTREDFSSDDHWETYKRRSAPWIDTTPIINRRKPNDPADIFDNTVKNAEWIIPGVLPKNIVGILAAPGGGYKSTFAIHLAISALTGYEVFPGFRFPKPMTVGGIFTETTEERFFEQVRAICENFGIPMEFVKQRFNGCSYMNFVDSCENPTVALGEIRRNAISRNGSSFDLIILDNFSKIFDGENENDNVEVGRWMSWIGEMVECGGSLLLLHHTGKKSKGEVDDIRGASSMIASARWAATMTVKDEEEDDQGEKRIKLKIVKCNDARLTEFNFWTKPVHWVNFDGSMVNSFVIEEQERGNLSEAEKNLRARIIDFVRESDDGLSRKEIDKDEEVEEFLIDLNREFKTDLSRKDLGRILDDLVSSGRLKKRSGKRRGNSVEVYDINNLVKGLGGLIADRLRETGRSITPADFVEPLTETVSALVDIVSEFLPRTEEVPSAARVIWAISQVINNERWFVKQGENYLPREEV